MHRRCSKLFLQFYYISQCCNTYICYCSLPFGHLPNHYKSCCSLCEICFNNNFITAATGHIIYAKKCRLQWHSTLSNRKILYPLHILFTYERIGKWQQLVLILIFIFDIFWLCAQPAPIRLAKEASAKLQSGRSLLSAHSWAILADRRLTWERLSSLKNIVDKI